MPDTRPDMRQRALFVTSNAACRWNKMLLAELKVDIPRAAIVVLTEHRARWASGCHPPSVEIGTGNSCTLLPASWTIAAYLETFPAQAAFKIFKGFCTASRIRAWLSGWQIVPSNRSVPPVLPSARISGRYERDSGARPVLEAVDKWLITANEHTMKRDERALSLICDTTA